MSDHNNADNANGDGNDTGRTPKRARILQGRGRLTVLVVLTVLAAAVAWWSRDRAGQSTDPLAVSADAPTAAVDLPQAGDRAVVLVFPNWDGRGYVSEDRRVGSRGQPGEDLLSLMQSLCEGPRGGRAISALPRGTRVLSAFVDPKKGTAVVDFSGELVGGHPGGSAAETATVTSILRTVAANFPQIGAFTILVDGRQVETLAGHLDLTRPFSPRRWL